MRFEPALEEGVLERRYKRFLADVQRADGRTETVHCPNTGSMLGCAIPGSRVWTSRSAAKGRKYPHTLELVEADGVLVGVHTGRANALVAEALAAGRLPGLDGEVQAEVSVPDGVEPPGGRRSRLDFRLATADGPCWVEVKSVTLGAAALPDAGLGADVALFPDAVSARGARHLETLAALRQGGARAMLLFCVQRAGVREVRPADSIDPAYAAALRAAMAAGVEVRALGATLDPGGIRLHAELPVVVP